MQQVPPSSEPAFRGGVRAA